MVELREVCLKVMLGSILPQDFTEVKRLHGMSTIKKQQLIEVMRKIVSLYEQKKNRNLVVSADDFKYIFNQNELEDSDIDNNLKITLLINKKVLNVPKN